MQNSFGTNTELLSEISNGNLKAEAELVNLYSKSLRFILSRRSNDAQLISDVVQDTFIVVISKARKSEINNPEALAAFIRQTGVNILLAHFRKETRRATDAFGEVNVEIPDSQVGLTEALESKQALELVQQTMDELKVERDRDLLHAYFVDEEDKKDICDRMELTPAHFDRVLFRARARLKQLIQFRLGGKNVFD